MKKEVQKNRENLLSEPKKMGSYALNDNRDRILSQKEERRVGHRTCRLPRRQKNFPHCCPVENYKGKMSGIWGESNIFAVNLIRKSV